MLLVGGMRREVPLTEQDGVDRLNCIPGCACRLEFVDARCIVVGICDGRRTEGDDCGLDG
jgi:hypothetical protein